MAEVTLHFQNEAADARRVARLIGEQLLDVGSTCRPTSCSLPMAPTMAMPV